MTSGERSATTSAAGEHREVAQLSAFGRFLTLVSDSVDRGTTFLAVLATVALAAVMLLGVFFRYVLNSSLSWSDEVALFIFGWVAFLFIASAYLHDKHVAVDVLVQMLPPRWQARAALVAEGLSGGYLISLLVASVQAIGIVAKGRTDALHIPMTVQFVAIPVAAALMMVHWMRRNLAQGVRPPPSPSCCWRSAISGSSFCRLESTFT